MPTITSKAALSCVLLVLVLLGTAAAADGYCGDKSVDPPEMCDDGNSNNGDGCSSACIIESSWACGGEPNMCAFKRLMDDDWYCEYELTVNRLQIIQFPLNVSATGPARFQVQGWMTMAANAITPASVFNMTLFGNYQNILVMHFNHFLGTMTTTVEGTNIYNYSVAVKPGQFVMDVYYASGYIHWQLISGGVVVVYDSNKVENASFIEGVKFYQTTATNYFEYWFLTDDIGFLYDSCFFKNWFFPGCFANSDKVIKGEPLYLQDVGTGDGFAYPVPPPGFYAIDGVNREHTDVAAVWAETEPGYIVLPTGYSPIGNADDTNQEYKWQILCPQGYDGGVVYTASISRYPNITNWRCILSGIAPVNNNGTDERVLRPYAPYRLSAILTKGCPQSTIQITNTAREYLQWLYLDSYDSNAYMSLYGDRSYESKLTLGMHEFGMHFVATASSLYDICAANYRMFVNLDYVRVSYRTKNATCYGSENGEAEIFVDGGGTPPFTFSWSSGQNTSKITAGAGVYTPTVVTASGCSQRFETLQIFHPNDPLSVSLLQIVPGSDDSKTSQGKIVLSVDGGTPPYTQFFTSINNITTASNSSSNGTIYYEQITYGSTVGADKRLTRGLYNYSVYDFNGCSVLSEDRIIVPEVYLLNYTSNLVIADIYPAKTETFSFSLTPNRTVYRFNFARNSDLTVQIQFTNKAIIPTYGDVSYDSSDTPYFSSKFSENATFQTATTKFCRHPVSEYYDIVSTPKVMKNPRILTCEPLAGICVDAIIQEMLKRNSSISNCSDWQTTFLSTNASDGTTYGSCTWFKCENWKLGIKFDSPTCEAFDKFTYTSNDTCCSGFRQQSAQCAPLTNSSQDLICDTNNLDYVCDPKSDSSNVTIKSLHPSVEYNPDFDDFICSVEYLKPEYMYEVSYTVSFQGQKWTQTSRYTPIATSTHQSDTNRFDFLSISHDVNFYVEDNYLIDMDIAGKYDVMLPYKNADVMVSAQLFSVCTQNWPTMSCARFAQSQLFQVNKTNYYVANYSVANLGPAKSSKQIQYSVANSQTPPTIQIEVAPALTPSILRIVVNDSTISLNLAKATWVSQNDSIWIAKVVGGADNCPGFVGIQVVQNYTVLLHYDMILQCSSSTKNNFEVYFGINPKDLSRDYLSNISFVIQDKVTDISVFPPTTKQTYDLGATYPETVYINTKVIVTVIGFLGGSLVLLIIILIIGVKLPKSESTNRLTSRHMLIIVSYVLYKVLSHILISCTVIFVCWRAWNQDYLSTLYGFPEWLEKYNNETETQVTTVNVYLDVEITRQDDLWRLQQAVCDLKMMYMSTNVSQLKADIAAYHDLEMNARNLTKMRYDLNMKNWEAANLQVQALIDANAADLDVLTAQIEAWYAYSYQFFKDYESLTIKYNLDVTSGVDVDVHKINTVVAVYQASWKPIKKVVDFVRPIAKFIGYGSDIPDWPDDLPPFDINVVDLPNLPQYSIDADFSANVDVARVSMPDLKKPELFVPSIDEHVPKVLAFAQPYFSSLSQSTRGFDEPEYVNWSFNVAVSLTLTCFFADAFIMCFKLARTWRGLLKLIAGRKVVEDKTNNDLPTVAIGAVNDFVAWLHQFLQKLQKFYAYIPLILPYVIKLLLAVAVIVVSALFLVALLNLLNIETLEKVGLVQYSTYSVSVSVSIANFRINANAQYTNEISMESESASTFTKIQSQKQELSIFNAQEAARVSTFNSEYMFLCESLDLGSECLEVKRVKAEYSFPSGCQFDPIVPRLYIEFDEEEFEDDFKSNLAVYVQAARDVVIATMWFAIAVVSTVVGLGIVGAIMWFVLEKLDLLRVNRYALVNA